MESRLTSHTFTDYYIDEYRSVVHINDVILTIRHFLNIALLNNTPETTNKVTTQVYNLGGSTRVSRYDIATAVANYLQLDTSSINAVNRPIIGGGGRGGTVPSPADISMNVSKLTNELGVERMLGLDEIVALTYKKNNDAYVLVE